MASSVALVLGSSDNASSCRFLQRGLDLLTLLDFAGGAHATSTVEEALNFVLNECMTAEGSVIKNKFDVQTFQWFSY